MVRLKTINDDEDAVTELRMLHKLHRVPSYRLSTRALDAFDILRMGTINGARALGFEGAVGALREGWMADLILVDLDRVLDDPWCAPDLSIAEAFIHRASGRDVATVVVGGKVVVENRVARTLDVPALYREIRRAARGISPAQRRRAELLQRLKPYYQEWYDAWLPDGSDPFYVPNSRV